MCCVCCGCVWWGAVDGGALSLMGVMCVQLFRGLCVSWGSWCALFWKWVSVCVVCFLASMPV